MNQGQKKKKLSNLAIAVLIPPPPLARTRKTLTTANDVSREPRMAPNGMPDMDRLTVATPVRMAPVEKLLAFFAYCWTSSFDYVLYLVNAPLYFQMVEAARATNSSNSLSYIHVFSDMLRKNWKRFGKVMSNYSWRMRKNLHTSSSHLHVVYLKWRYSVV